MDDLPFFTQRLVLRVRLPRFDVAGAETLVAAMCTAKLASFGCPPFPLSPPQGRGASLAILLRINLQPCVTRKGTCMAWVPPLASMTAGTKVRWVALPIFCFP